MFTLQIEDIELVERRGYLTIRFSLPREGGTLLLRKTDGIRKWHQALQVSQATLFIQTFFIKKYYSNQHFNLTLGKTKKSLMKNMSK